MNFEDKDYEVTSSREVWGKAHRAMKILVAGFTMTQEDRIECSHAVDALFEKLELLAANRDPAVLHQRQEITDAIIKLFDGLRTSNRTHSVIPNEYCSRACCAGIPWLAVNTNVGQFKVGWRKRVIVIDWSKTTLNWLANDVFPDENVTKDGQMIHAWSYEDARRYLEKLLYRSR